MTNEIFAPSSVHMLPPHQVSWNEARGDFCGQNYTVWYFGDITPASLSTLFSQLAAEDSETLFKKFKLWLESERGHFAVYGNFGDFYFASVDRVRSKPLYVHSNRDQNIVKVASHFSDIHAGARPSEIDNHGVISLWMSGYTIGPRTIDKNTSQLRAGECYASHLGQEYRDFFYLYKVWDNENFSEEVFRRNLKDCTLSILEEVKEKAHSRQIVLALSGGYDSRLIASGLKCIGAKNIVTFSYGRKNNFEAKAARDIAHTLGVPWHFVDLDIPKMRTHFQSSTHMEYKKFADSGASVPFEQDFFPLFKLKEMGIVSDDALILNGNSGDYISGGHISNDLVNLSQVSDPQNRRQTILDALIKKHCSFWRGMLNENMRTILEDLLWQEITSIIHEEKLGTSQHAAFETSELLNRQSKYVISGQRTYEFLGHEWALPLWDTRYLDFWAKVPIHLKQGQKLYREMLEQENWGNVWNNIPVNKKYISPAWIRPLRNVAKPFFAFQPRQNWKDFDKKYFAYWMNNTCISAAVSYKDVRTDRLGARNIIAWHTRKYLEEKDIYLKDVENMIMS